MDKIKKQITALVLTLAMLTALLPVSVLPAEAADAQSVQDMYRLYNRSSGEHFYTASSAEKDHLRNIGWNYEGIGWRAPLSSNTPVHRLYNPYAGEHHYTADEGEVHHLTAIGWTYEGIGWYSDDAKTVPLYRQYNPYALANNHNYTTSVSENEYLVSLGWRAEGIGWYGTEAGEPAANEEDAVYDDYSMQVLAIVNLRRAENGLAPLKMHPSLKKAADIRAKELVTSFSHTRPDGSSCFTVLDELNITEWWSCGENIAAGQSTPEAAMYSWMNSPGHRANILGENYTDIGVGFYYDPNVPYQYFWVQLFMEE